MYALSPENGRQAWAYTGELGIVQSGIAVAGGRVYVGDGTGNIVALRA